MGIIVNIVDYSKVVLRALDGNVQAALEAMGITAVGLIVQQMEHGYGKPIRKTGDLMRDVQYKINLITQTVKVGNTLEYADEVHNGTHKMRGRPYVSDALTSEDHIRQIRQVAEQNLKHGF